MTKGFETIGEREARTKWQQYGYYLRTIELMGGAIQDAACQKKDNPQLAVMMLQAPVDTLNDAFRNLVENMERKNKEAADERQ